MDELDRLRGAMHRDPRAVADRSTVIARAARAGGDRAALSRSLSLRGRAHRSLGEIDLARHDLDEAITVADGLDPDLAADAHLGLAGVLSFAGELDAALAHLDTAERLGGPRTVAYVTLQRAAVAQRAGLLDQARAVYDLALPTLEHLKASTDAALVRMNRGMIRVATGDLGGAEEDLVAAERWFAVDANHFGVAQVRHGLGIVRLRAGDLPGALSCLDDADRRFAELDYESLDVRVDRVEALLAAGLAADAAAEAADLADRFTEAGNHSLAAEAWLRCAQAARLDGDRQAARAHATTARELFHRCGAAGWERLAHLEVLRAEPAGDGVESRRLADAMAAAGDVLGSAGALALACRAAVEAGDAVTALSLARDCQAHARRVDMLELRVLGAHAAAASAVVNADVPGARRALRRGLDDVLRHQATFGATDARAAVARQADDLVALGLRLALAGGRPASLFEWIELSREARRHLTAGLPPADPELASRLADLRRLAVALRAARGAGEDATELVAEMRGIERAVHHRQLATGSARARIAVRPPGLAALQRRLDGRRFVTLAEVDGRIAGVVVGPGRARTHDLGPVAPVESAAAGLAAGLRALADPGLGVEPRRLRAGLLEQSMATLDALLAPVLAGDEPLMLSLPAGLHAVPWPALPGLTGRLVTIVPSAGWWYDLPDRDVARPTSVMVAVGPHLEHGRTEAERVVQHHRIASLLADERATTANVLSGLRTADVSHIVAHAHIRHDNPLWSSLELADGPMCLYELERAEQVSPVVVLSACDSGRGVRAGDQMVGLSSCLLARGTRSLVASVSRLPDDELTADVMGQLHQHLARTGSVAAALSSVERGDRLGERHIHAAYLAAYGDW